MVSNVLKWKKGSPPRMWEVLCRNFLRPPFLRITPTYVGSTIKSVSQVWGPEDHPHVCGKYEVVAEKIPSGEGSPPRMWEVPINAEVCQSAFGITPTYVGSTLDVTLSCSEARDHPHVCGKYFSWLCTQPII